MFRHKESSNRIELSQLVQDLLNFGVLGSLWLWGWGGGWGCPTHMCTCTHMHACAPGACMHMCTHVHACTCARACGKHDNFMQMAAPLGESLGIPYDVICTCTCMHAHACAHVWGTPCHHPPPTSTYPSPPGGGTPRINQNSKALELIEIF